MRTAVFWLITCLIAVSLRLRSATAHPLSISDLQTQGEIEGDTPITGEQLLSSDNNVHRSKKSPSNYRTIICVEVRPPPELKAYTLCHEKFDQKLMGNSGQGYRQHQTGDHLRSHVGEQSENQGGPQSVRYAGQISGHAENQGGPQSGGYGGQPSGGHGGQQSGGYSGRQYGSDGEHVSGDHGAQQFETNGGSQPEVYEGQRFRRHHKHHDSHKHPQHGHHPAHGHYHAHREAHYSTHSSAHHSRSNVQQMSERQSGYQSQAYNSHSWNPAPVSIPVSAPACGIPFVTGCTPALTYMPVVHLPPDFGIPA